MVPAGMHPLLDPGLEWGRPETHGGAALGRKFSGRTRPLGTSRRPRGWCVRPDLGLRPLRQSREEPEDDLLLETSTSIFRPLSKLRVLFLSES